jgi:hypothetical protein
MKHLQVSLQCNTACVAINKQAAVEWILETFPPFLDVRVPASEPPTVEIFVGIPPPEFPRGQRTPVPLFLGGRGHRLRTNTSTWIVDDTTGDAVVRERATLRAWIGGVGPGSYQACARLVREWLLRDVPHVRLHAAALSLRGKGVLLIGAGGSGKSTVLSALLRDGGQYIANDRVLLSQAGELFGLPIAVRWSERQLGMHEAGRAAIDNYWDRSLLCRRDDRAGFAKYEFLPCEVERIAGCRAVTGVKAAAVVILGAPGSHHDATEISSASGDVFQTAMAASVLEPDPAFPLFFEDPDGTARAVALRREAAQSVAGLPALRTAASAPTTLDVIRAWLDHVLAQ